MSDEVVSRISEFLNRERPWYSLPQLLAMPKLIAIRNELRKQNLYDTEEPPHADPTGPVDPEKRRIRSFDGAGTDLSKPRMGAAGTRFGRNFPFEHTRPDAARLMTPNPRVVSETLLARREFQPATILNLLAAAWIQFMVHDWFVHRRGARAEGHQVPLPPGDTWPENPMLIAKTEPDAVAVSGSTRPPAYVNENSHWWDGSQIYGCTPEVCAQIRTNVLGRIRVGPDGRIPVDPATGVEVTGFTENTWIGLSMLHGLFAMEHNAICERLAQGHPEWSDEKLFQTARLINGALMAKIHTVEWTPAIVPHPVIQVAMNANWYGIAGADLQEIFRFLDDNEILGGIVGSEAAHHAAPYSLTEEFVAVYRMHPLMPDELQLRAIGDDRSLGTVPLPDALGRRGLTLRDQHNFTDLFYSFGRMHPGAVRLHNYPHHLRNLTRDDGERLDLATIDILRDRERGIPRYNQFRRLLRKPPVQTFEELTDNPAWAEEIKRVYNGDIEAVDLLVGLYAEPLPDGFGFSETAFRIFVLMASRRLKSDRFFTDDYSADVYSQIGLDWIDQNSMLTVLQRHFPGLAPALNGVQNAFHPWKKTGA